ncbi:MAG TPA: glycoside hydrolase domain-containing protein [Verrucomicrobiae bacterium]|nr:glycoside hydrolase domain-containing protein [Verrucomicrobiae bacterium]
MFTIQNNDSGSSDTVLAGFDCYAYPGDAAMTWLFANSNLRWVGYYLYPAPSRNVAANGGNSWMGQLHSLNGWVVSPIYVGEQDPAHQDQDPGNSSNPSANKGTADGYSDEVNSGGMANSAVPLLKQEGFPAGTTVYLDVETSGTQSQPELDYIASWCAAVKLGNYNPGIYCLESAYSSIASAAPTATYWISNPNNPSPQGFTFPTMPPTGSGVPTAIAWQYETARSYTIALPTSVAAAGSLQVDLDVANASSATGSATTPALGGPIVTGTQISFSLQTVPGFDYVLQFTRDLSNPTRQDIQTNSGGGLMSFADAIGSQSNGFYRVRKQPHN